MNRLTCAFATEKYSHADKKQEPQMPYSSIALSQATLLSIRALTAQSRALASLLLPINWGIDFQKSACFRRVGLGLGPGPGGLRSSSVLLVQTTDTRLSSNNMRPQRTIDQPWSSADRMGFRGFCTGQWYKVNLRARTCPANVPSRRVSWLLRQQFP